MNCCENKNDKSSNKDNMNIKGNNHKPWKHMLHMVLCCGLPIIIIMSLPWISGISPSAARILSLIAPFICPIMMGSMMFMMFAKSRKANNVEVKNPELPINHKED